jgi:hypothetical protein
LAVGAGPAAGAVRLVTSLGDTGASGQLRTEINLAEAGDVILVPAGTITLTGAAGNDDNTSGDLDVTKEITIQGVGAQHTIVDGGGLDRVFHVLGGATVTIAGLTIRNGNPGVASSGGGVLVAGPSTLTLTNVLVTQNAAAVFGGGVAGGMTATIILSGVTLADNAAGVHGGGLESRLAATLVNTTVSGNRAGAFGGGIAVTSGTATLNNVTITANTADSDNAGGGDGGGISQGDMTVVTLRNTLIAGNAVGSSGTGPDCDSTLGGVYTSRGSNLIGNPGPSCTFVPAPATADDLVGVDPVLGPLAQNGGPTPTHALLAGSAAIEAGDGACEPADQRGVVRPQGGRCDIGAVEALAPPGSLTLGPPTGVYAVTSVLDLILILHAPGRDAVGGQLVVDGVDVTASLGQCPLAIGVLPPSGLTVRCPGVPAGALGPGVHTISARIDLSDGTALQQTVTWDIRSSLGP